MRRSAYITGADRGLGLALANEMLKTGYHVFAGSYLQDWPELAELSRQYKETLTIVPLDVTNPDSVKQAAARIARETDALNVVLNNAGIAKDRSGTIFDEQYEADIRALFETNTLGPLRVTQSVLPLLLKGEGQRLLLNISSAAASIGGVTRTNQYGYTMSKAALNMQGKLIQNHLKAYGVKVLLVHPGWMHTRIFGDLNRMKDAPLEPEDSAAAIMQLMTTHADPDSPMFVDYAGNEMPW